MGMKIQLVSSKAVATQAGLLVVLVPEWTATKKKSAAPAVLAELDAAFGGTLMTALAAEEYVAKKDSTCVISTLGYTAQPKVAFVGLGSDEPSTASVRTALAKASRLANTEKVAEFAVLLPENFGPHLRAAAEGLELGAYKFSTYFTGDRAPKKVLGSVKLIINGKAPANAKQLLDQGQAVAAGVNVARDLSNEPPNVVYPESFAARAKAMAKTAGLNCKVIDYKEVVRKKMGLLDAVGRGSENKPCMVHLSYVPKGKASGKKIVFVGKGVTFDTGGISLKPGAGMHEMKHDMSGAANVFGLMQAIAALRPDIEVHGITPLAENMPAGNAYRPGDIWTSYLGKTVEIQNTDAEGRLILADALTYAVELKPDFLVDNATLTGAAVVALGTTCSGWYASSEETAKIFGDAVQASGEQMWRMPLLEDQKDQLKSDCADLKNVGDRWGGSITAALFLREFIGDTKHWVHADIAGPAMADKVTRWDPRSGTGHGVLTFLSLVERAAAKK